MFSEDKRMCRPNKWWWGLLPLAILWFLASYARNDLIQNDLAAKAKEKYSWAAVTLDGRDATVSGIAPDDAAKDGVLAAIDAIPGVRKVAAGDLTVIPEAKPFVFDATREGDAVTLSGFVPSEEVRKQIAEATQKAIPDAKITDNLKLARGAGPAFGAAAIYGVSQLTALTKGKFALSDVTAKLTGDAPSEEVFNAVTAAAPPAELAITKEITAPPVSPYVFEASRNGTAITLDGFIPAEDVRKPIADAAAAAIPGAVITDNLKVASGAPEGFASAAAFAVAELGKLGKGVSTLTDKSYFIAGQAPSQEVLQQVIAGVPAGFAAEAHRVTAPQPAPAPKVEPAPPVEADVVVPPADPAPVVVEVGPYVWSATKAGNAITLEGFVPDDATRAEIVASASAQNPGATVSDKMTINTGAPAAFAGMTAASLGHLGKLEEGKGSLTNVDYTIVGRASTSDSYNAVLGEAAALTEGYKLAAANITAPVGKPYVFGVEKADNGAVTLTGFYPNDGIRASINQAAAAAFPGATVTDKMTIASGPPANYEAMIGFGLGQVGRLTTGKANISDTSFAIEGAAPTVALFNRANDAVKKLPRGFTLASANITGPTASPYRWVASKANNAVTLTGFVPSEEAKTFLAERAKTVFAGATITDNQEVSLGAPPGFAGMAVGGMNQLAALNFGEARLDDAKYSITGEAPNQEVFDVSTKAANSPAAGFATANVAITVAIPVVRPYLVEVRKAASGDVTLLGHAPNAAEKETLASKAKALAAGKSVDDRTTIALGLPESVNYGAATGAMMAELGKLQSGTARLADDQLSFYGNAASLQIHDDVTKRLDGVLVGGMQKKDVSISYPVTRPYVWSAERTPGVITLRGLYEREADKTAVVAAATTRFPGEKVVDEMKPAAGAPACYMKAVDLSLLQLSRLIFGKSELSDANLAISGEAQTDAAAGEIRTATSALGDGCKGAALITVRAAEPPVTDNECQTLFKDVLARGPILFDRDRSEIKAESFGRLDNLVFVAKRCPDARVEIGAHTDSDASDSYNDALSQRRAKAVVDYLVNGGITAGRLTSTGYGEKKPLVPNTSRDNKAQNRRVELIVQ
jgi:OmpA-OmpF porin, OOP family